MNVQEANRQLQLAVHDAQVAFDCVELGEIDRAHTHALMARTAADAAETVLRYALAEERGEPAPSVERDPGGLNGVAGINPINEVDQVDQVRP